MVRDDGKSALSKDDPFYLSDAALFAPDLEGKQPTKYQTDKSGTKVKWDLHPGIGSVLAPEASPEDGPPPLNCVAFSKTGRHVACGTGDGRVGVWNCQPLPSLLTVLGEREPATRTLEITHGNDDDSHPGGAAAGTVAKDPDGVAGVGMRCRILPETAMLQAEDVMVSVATLQWSRNNIVALGPIGRIAPHHTCASAAGKEKRKGDKRDLVYSKHSFKMLTWDMKGGASAATRPLLAVYFRGAVDSVCPHPTNPNILVCCSNLQQETPYPPPPPSPSSLFFLLLPPFLPLYLPWYPSLMSFLPSLVFFLPWYPSFPGTLPSCQVPGQPHYWHYHSRASAPPHPAGGV
jgi:hypothetical protein